MDTIWCFDRVTAELRALTASQNNGAINDSVLDLFPLCLGDSASLITVSQDHYLGTFFRSLF
jgi:hypothetical protein